MDLVVCGFVFFNSTSFSRLFSRTPWVSRHQKGKLFWILMKQEMMGWHWHQLDHMQVICTSLQTDNYASTLPLSFYRPDALSDAQPIASKLICTCDVFSIHWWSCQQCCTVDCSGLQLVTACWVDINPYLHMCCCMTTEVLTGFMSGTLFVTSQLGVLHCGSCYMLSVIICCWETTVLTIACLMITGSICQYDVVLMCSTDFYSTVPSLI